MHCIHWLLFYKLCLCIFVFAYKHISFMHCNQSISFYKYHFIHPCISIELFKFSFNSFHSLYLILHISNYQFQFNACNSIHHYFASLSLHLFFMLLFLCISLYVLFLCDISLSLSLSVYMNFIIKDVEHMLWFFIGWKIRSD